MAKKQNLSYQDIEASLEVFKDRQVPASEVGYCILKAFGKSDADIRRYREGKGVLTSYDGLLIKGLLGYKSAATTQMTSVLESMKSDMQVTKAAPKIIAVSDGVSILAFDLREKESYENPLSRLYCDFAFFYPLCGVERFESVSENPADVKAAEKLAKLHDELRAYNEFSSKSELHDLNIFIARLLFCFFAEDTGIFEDNLFTGSVVRYTKEDGSNLADYLSATFNVMDIRVRNEDTMKIITQFPYVNGGLFSKTIQIPKMGYRARKIIIECGELNWKDINPDIFGSMIQAVVDPNVRANQGMHYTSVPNIMKVINPLFLDDLRAEYQKLQDGFAQQKRLMEVGMLNLSQFHKEVKPIHSACKKLLARMAKMKFFDPACGSGNFLIITYKMLRLLEMDILRLMRQVIPELDFIDGSCITLSQFYGIELLDFPHEVAMLSMWLAEHQMNRKLHDDFGVNTRALPLHNITQIQCGNACRLDWNTACPHEKEEEVFVFGNPPYLGTKWQNEIQKSDIDLVMPNNQLRRSLDYISCWFYLAAKYIAGTKAKSAFVSTNSICQGEQVPALWPIINELNVEIEFCYLSFKWENNAKDKAGVTCIIIGLTYDKPKAKYIYSVDSKHQVENINYYLLNAPSIIVTHRSTTLSNIPKMIKGSQPTDGGALLMTEEERNDMLKMYPQLQEYIRQYMGADDLINGITRYCLWLKNALDDILNIPIIQKRLELVKQSRLKSTKKSTNKQAATPHLFTEDRQPKTDYFILPVVSSERREYLPVSYNSKDIIANTNAQMIPASSCYIFGIIESHIHFVWMKTVCGRMRTDYAYSVSVVYNTFPFPKIMEEKKLQLTEAAEEVLLIRAEYPERTLAKLYDPDKMPQDLREAHAALDDIVDSCYPGYPFANDEARLECLFKLYEKMTSK